MTIKDMPHVTCEQVLALRDAAIKLEEQNHKLKTRLRAMQECAIKCHECHADHSDVLGE